MSKFHYIFFTLLLLQVGYTSAWSQQPGSGVPPPSPPFVNPPPPESTWVIDITSNQSTKPADLQGLKEAPHPIRLVLAMGRDQMEKGVISYSDGTDKTFYVYQHQIMQIAGNSSRVLAWSPSNLDPPDLRCIGFPHTSWISSQNYKGVEKQGKTVCYRYQDSSGNIAFIAAANRLPLSIQIKDTNYQFSQAPSFAAFELPAAFLASLNKLEAEASALEAMQATENKH